MRTNRSSPLSQVSNECPLCRVPFTALLNKNGMALECSIAISFPADHELNFELSQSTLESLANLDDINWQFIASSFLNQTGQVNLNDQQQCEQINSILNTFFGHFGLESEMEAMQWPF